MQFPAIKSDAKNIYCGVATPGSFYPSTQAQGNIQVATASDGRCDANLWKDNVNKGGGNPESFTGSKWANKLIEFKGAHDDEGGAWASTGFSQQQFVNYANNIIEHKPYGKNGKNWVIKRIDQGPCELSNDQTKCKWNGEKRSVTNDDCMPNSQNGMSEQPPTVICLLVFTNTKLLSVELAKHGRKPAFSILAPRAWVYLDGSAGQLHGVVAAERVLSTGGNAGQNQFHGVPFAGTIETKADCAC